MGSVKAWVCLKTKKIQDSRFCLPFSMISPKFHSFSIDHELRRQSRHKHTLTLTKISTVVRVDSDFLLSSKPSSMQDS